MAKNEQLKINLKEYQNKSRRGLYIVIKQTGKPQRLYKYYGNYGEIDATKKYYEDKYIKRKPLGRSQRAYRQAYQKAIEQKPETNKTRVRIRRQAQQYIKKVKAGKTLESYVKTGMAKITIDKATAQNPSSVNNKIKQLLSQLIIDKNIIEIMAQNENLEKIKHRFEYKAKITNENGQTLMELNKFNQTPLKALQELKNAVETGEDVDNDKGYNGKTRNQLKNYRWNEQGHYPTKGKVTQTQLTITLRK